jgi:hypothetical protein
MVNSILSIVESNKVNTDIFESFGPQLRVFKTIHQHDPQLSLIKNIINMEWAFKDKPYCVIYRGVETSYRDNDPRSKVPNLSQSFVCNRPYGVACTGAISNSKDEINFREILVSNACNDLSTFDSSLREFLKERTIFIKESKSLRSEKSSLSSPSYSFFDITRKQNEVRKLLNEEIVSFDKKTFRSLNT